MLELKTVLASLHNKSRLTSLNQRLLKYAKTYHAIGHVNELVYLRLGVISIINLSTIVPVLWLLSFRVLDFLWRQKVPVLLQTARFYFLIINLHNVCLIWVQNQCVQVA